MHEVRNTHAKDRSPELTDSLGACDVPFEPSRHMRKAKQGEQTAGQRLSVVFVGVLELIFHPFGGLGTAREHFLSPGSPDWYITNRPAAVSGRITSVWDFPNWKIRVRQYDLHHSSKF